MLHLEQAAQSDLPPEDSLAGSTDNIERQVREHLTSYVMCDLLALTNRTFANRRCGNAAVS